MVSQRSKIRLNNPIGIAASATIFGVLVATALGAVPPELLSGPSKPSGARPGTTRPSPLRENPDARNGALRGPNSARPAAVAQRDKPTGPATAKTPAAPAATSEKQPPAAAATEREKLFVDWKAPKAALVISGMLEGHIEPCGCTGLTNQKGGLMRRHTLMKELAADWKCEIVPIDAGSHVNRSGRQAELKFQKMFDAYRVMKYQAVALGPGDLRLSVGEFYTAMLSADGSTPFVSANVGIFDDKTLPQFRVVSVNGLKIGITTILGDSAHKALTSAELQFKPAAEALAAVLPQMKAAKCDVLVLVANATMDETKALADKFPDFRVVVTSGGAYEPLRRPEPTKSGAMLVEVGRKGIYAGVIGVYDRGIKTAPRYELKYQLVPLDARFTDSPEIVEVMASYQSELEKAWENGLEAYGIKPIDDTGRRQFVGSQKCGECHTKAFAVWEKSKHAHATESLIHPPERKTIARNFDAECLSCHVTGWEPQQFVPYLSGYMDGSNKQKTPLMFGSGCENCHGAGSRHVAAEEDATDMKLMTDLRKEMALPLKAAQMTCVKCHDLENSPDFHKKDAFSKYWKQIEHHGKD